MTEVRTAAFAIIGLLTVGVYGAAVLNGALPENALAVSVVGGLLVGVLVNALFRMLSSVPAGDDLAGATADSGVPSAGRGQDTDSRPPAGQPLANQSRASR